MVRKYALLALCMALICALLAGCAPVGLPIADDEPTVTLPPAEVSFLAPIGDASLEYTAPATLYLPRHDGMGLTTVESEVSFSPTRSNAESLARALLAHAGDGTASPVGGSVRLSLYGVNPVEVSRNVATVNLAANALQLSRDTLYLACQAIANTLTTLPEIEWVNFLVVDRPVGLDIANTLPMGAFSATTAQDIGAAYEQLLSRRVDSGSDASLKPLTSNVTLYFPVSGTDSVVSEVRSISLSKLQLTEDAVVYDVGAGTGSVSIEIALQAAEGEVYAIEKKEEAAALLEKNKRKFAADHLHIIRGLAPEALADLPAPTHVFIGGSSGNLKEILEVVLAKNPHVRIVINAIALETVAEALDCLKTLPVKETDVAAVSVAKAKELGRYHMMMGQNPVYVISCTGGNPS